MLDLGVANDYLTLTGIQYAYKKYSIIPLFNKGREGKYIPLVKLQIYVKNG